MEEVLSKIEAKYYYLFAFGAKVLVRNFHFFQNKIIVDIKFVIKIRAVQSIHRCSSVAVFQVYVFTCDQISCKMWYNRLQ